MYVKKTRGDWYNAGQTDIIPVCVSSFDGKAHILLRNDIRAGKFNVEAQQRKFIIGQFGLNLSYGKISKVTTIMLDNLRWISVWFIAKLFFFFDVKKESFRCLKRQSLRVVLNTYSLRSICSYRRNRRPINDFWFWLMYLTLQSKNINSGAIADKTAPLGFILPYIKVPHIETPLNSTDLLIIKRWRIQQTNPFYPEPSFCVWKWSQR